MTIQQLSQEIGIGMDTLRVWERRYGFPVPERDARGHRRYTRQQLEELLIVKQLQILGERPQRIFSLTSAERRTLLETLSGPLRPGDEGLQRLVFAGPPGQIATELAERRDRLGLTGFVEQTVIPLLQLLDHGWASGSLGIAREHLISDQLELILKGELAASVPGDGPRMLFLTLPGERHKLGLLLAAVLFRQAGVEDFWLNEELPLSEIPGLAAELKVDAVALSFSSHYPARQAKQDLRSLRRSLDPVVTIVAGGQAVRQMSSMPKLLICTDLRLVPELVGRHFRPGPP